MEAVDRQEYPAMLDRLQPNIAVAKLNERVKRIGRVNVEIADWIQERRKVEESYVAGLRKLARKPLAETGGELGIFDRPWKSIISETEAIASSHAQFSQRIERDVEHPLRAFITTNKEMAGMPTIQGNLTSMAKELEEAQKMSDKISAKGGKASAQKAEHAASRLSNAEQQWQSQAPFVFETLQALDERRLNHVRDALTQYETHESDTYERNRATVAQTVDSLLGADTAAEIKAWSEAAVAGRAITERRARQLSSAGTGNSSLATPPTPRSTQNQQHPDNVSENSGNNQLSAAFQMKSRFGTMLGRRRQSIHGGFARAPSPSKGFTSLGRNSASREGRSSASPRESSNNLESSPSRDNRLSSLAESPRKANGDSNGINQGPSNFLEMASLNNGSRAPQTPDLSDVQPPPGPPPSHMKLEAQTDAEGFTLPAAMNDPISQAQQEAHAQDAQDSEQPQFKLDIRREPIPEQDADAQAALSNVANTLRSAQPTPGRKVGTVRGRRDVRNTVYIPAGNPIAYENNIPPSPSLPSSVSGSRTAALAAMAEHGLGGRSTSDTTSIRSGHSLGHNAVAKHADMHAPGLNASVIETVTATFENGDVKTLKIGGEIALNYIPPFTESFSINSAGTETVRINNFPNLEAIGPNRTFVHPKEDKPDEFTVDIATISHRTSAAFAYRVHLEQSQISSHAPLLIKPTWKAAGNDLALIIEYCLNPSFEAESVTFSNFYIVATHEGAKAIGCQTKPVGIHKKDQSLVYWRIGDLTLNKLVPYEKGTKVLCKFVGAEGAAPTPGHIEARWEVHNTSTYPAGSGITLSRLGAPTSKSDDSDPFADESLTSPTTSTPASNWVDVETNNKIVSGKYEGRGTVLG